MKKLLMTIPFLILFVTSVLAVQIVFTSVRAEGGVINYIGSDTSFTFSKTHLNVWHRQAYSVNNGNQGYGGLQITAINSLGERITLNLKFNEKNVIEESNTRLYVDNEAKGFYWKKGILPVAVSFDTLRYDLNKITGKLNIAGEGTINFRITGMDATILIPN